MKIIVLEAEIILFALILGGIIFTFLNATGFINAEYDENNPESQQGEYDIISLCDTIQDRFYRVVWVNGSDDIFHVSDKLYVNQNSGGNIIVRLRKSNIAMSPDYAKLIKVKAV